MNWDFVLKNGELALQKNQEKPKKKESRLWLFFTRLLPLYCCKRNNNDNRKRETVSKSSLSIHPCSLSVCRWNELLCGNSSGSSNSSAYRHIWSFIQVHNRRLVFSILLFLFLLLPHSLLTRKTSAVCSSDQDGQQEEEESSSILEIDGVLFW